jgi:tripartite-type tricarboxylate transporter receptor subunit TctC
MPLEYVMHFFSKLVVMALVASAGLVARDGIAQTYPNKPIRIVVPYPPGGTTDIVARTIGDRLTAAWGQPTVIDNRSGGAGVIGTEAAARAPADGYTLIVGNNQTHAMNAALLEKVPFDLLRDFQPLAFVASSKHVIVVPVASNAKTLAELIESGKGGGKLAFASSSPGSASHLISEALRQRNSMDATHVPYRGVGPAVTDLLGGQVQFMAATYPSVSQHIEAGKLRALAVASSERLAALAGVPTVKESGQMELSADAWFAFYAPAATPRAIVEQLNAEINRAIADAGVAGKLRGVGFEPRAMPLSVFEQFHRAEVTRWGELVRAVGVKISQ